jgi:tRNA A-37 threonylcarbamoyl transferase component Bud32
MKNKLIFEQVREVFPSSNVLKIVELNQGLSSSKIFMIRISSPSKKIILKVYPKTYENRLKKEIKILTELNQSDIPSPKIIHYDFKKLVLIMEYIQGVNLFEYFSAKKVDGKSLVSVGKNLARIHKLPIKEIWQDKKGIKSKKDWISFVEQRNKSNLLDIVNFSLLPEEQVNFLEEYLAEFLIKLQSSEIFLCPMHGDYSPKNILINKSQVSGILDFEIHRVGHNLNDLGIAYYWYKFYSREDLFYLILKGYKEELNLKKLDNLSIEPYYIMQVIGALSFLAKENTDKEAVSRLKNLLNEFLNNDEKKNTS